MKNRAIKIISILGVIFLGILSVQVSAQNDSVTDNRIYIIVPQMPTFPGNLDNYMGDHLHYPQSAIDRGIQGTVNVTFVISQTGEITDVTVLSGVSPELDSEAVRVVRAMPPWNPGIKNGKAVKVQYNLPVYFELSNGQNQQPMQRQVTYKPIDTVFILRDGLYVDPYIGTGEGGALSSTTTNTNLGLNLKFGMGISYFFPSGIGISGGLQIQQYKFGYTFSNITAPSSYNETATAFHSTAGDSTVTAGYNETINYSFLYAQLPLLCRYISSQENQLGFYAEAGLVANYLVSSQISGSAAETQYLLTQTPNSNIYLYNSTSSVTKTVSLTPQDPTKFTVSAHATAGILIPLATQISLILDASTDLGTTNAGSGSKDVIDFGTSKFYLFGSGQYGSFNAYLFEAKILIKMFGSSGRVRIN